MAHFYGVLQGSRGEVTRCGTTSSGLQATAASWSGAIVVSLYVDDEGRDCYRITETQWRNGAGVNREIASGAIGVK